MQYCILIYLYIYIHTLLLIIAKYCNTKYSIKSIIFVLKIMQLLFIHKYQGLWFLLDHYIITVTNNYKKNTNNGHYRISGVIKKKRLSTISEHYLEHDCSHPFSSYLRLSLQWCRLRRAFCRTQFSYSAVRECMRINLHFQDEGVCHKLRIVLFY